MEFINSKKDLAWGEFYFLSHVAPAEFNYKVHKKELSPFWESLGFKCSRMFEDFYSQLTGIHSDQYIPMDLYYFYMLPCLNRFDFRVAYTDKNMYTTLFPNIRQPETVIKCMNGLYYTDDKFLDSQLSESILNMLLLEKADCIIKPSVDSCNGNGIATLRNCSKEELLKQILEYGKNFIIQRKVKQHKEMAKLNESSLNTLRVFTYRSLDGKIQYLSGKTFGRFGGKGSVMDNGSAGGGLIQVNDDGTVADKVVYFKSMNVRGLFDSVGSITIPNFSTVKSQVVEMHKRLPHFDFIGWDIAIDTEGNPVFIEFNIEPSIEGPQMVSGPFGGIFLDEVIHRMKSVQKVKSICYRNIFANGNEYQQIVNR